MSGMTFWTIAYIVRICFAMMCLAIFASGVPQFHNGKYRNIVIVVNERIPEMSKDSIEILFSEASRSLFSATHGMAAFEEIVIIVPETWKSVDKSSDEMGSDFLPADIKIEEPNFEYGDDPYTVQQGECGEPGKYIHLTPYFLHISKQDTRKAAHLLVHEWAHLRYGVFDEHSLYQDESSFRWEHDVILPSTCNEGITGWIARELSLRRCHIRCGRVGSDCKFYPDPNTILKMSASIMTHPHLEFVNLFCNSSNHNEKAIFPHNRMCKGLSTFEVIMRHEDFKNESQNLSNVTRRFKSAVQLPKPKFIWKKSYRRRIVFVLDSSFNVQKGNWTFLLRQSLSRYILYHASNGSSFGIVNFSDYAQVLSEIAPVDNYRTNLTTDLSKMRIQKQRHGNASEGIREGIRILGREGGMVILLSAEESLVNLTNTESLVNNSVVINVIALGTKRNLHWEDLTRRTGGKFYLLNTRSKETGSEDVEMAIISSMTAVSNTDREPIIVFFERVQSNSPASIFLDESIGKNTILTASWSSSEARSPVLQFTPLSGKRYHHPKKQYITDPEYQVNRFLFLDAESGNWILNWTYAPRSGFAVDVIVTSETRDSSDPPIRLNAWVVNPKRDHLYGIESYQRIFAELRKGHVAVINASVIASVDFIVEGVVDTILRDDGSPPDVQKDDGIYANYMPLTSHQQRVSMVIVRASNLDGGARLRVGTRGSSLRMDSQFYEELRNKSGPSKYKFSVSDFDYVVPCDKIAVDAKPWIKYESLPQFSRVAIAGSPLLDNISAKAVHEARPPTIRDLRVALEFEERGSFFAVLQWTVPEDPRRGVKVSRIEVRGSANRRKLSMDFNDSHLIEILDEILPPNSMQELKVNISAEQLMDSRGSMNNYFFAIRPRDSHGNDGEISNIAEGFFDSIDKTYIVSEHEEVPIGSESQKARKDDKKTNWAIWIGASGGGFLLVLFIALAVAGVAVRRRGERGEEEDDDEDQSYFRRAVSTVSEIWTSTL